ncbi:MAG: DUF4097 domain-containing protein [Lachnospiraceae bacterium]|nr:DUF4097 domain-containing protein [Lachnospiraceae bacterium]
MKNSKVALLAAAAGMMVLILLISVLSVRNAPGRGGMTVFSLGGKAELRNTIEIPMSELDSLIMEYGSKNIKVYLSKEDHVTIKEYLFSDSPKAAASVSYTGEKEVVVTGAKMHAFIIFGFWKDGERIEVYVPEKGLGKLSIETGSGNITSEVSCISEGGSLLLKAGSGNIKWSNAAAEHLSAQTGSGNVRLENIKGNVLVRTGSGNITGNQMDGAMDAQAGSGNITLTGISGSASAQAGSGNVRLETDFVTGDIELTTGSGNIHLELPRDLEFYFNAETGSGNISTDFDDALSYNNKGNRAEGEIGEAKVKIHVKANSGNVRVSN